MKKVTRSLLVVAVFALLAGQVSADVVVNINFHKWGTPGVNTLTNAPGQGVLDDSGTIGAWNNVGNTVAITNIVDSAGNATTVALNIPNSGAWYQNSPGMAVLSDYMYLNNVTNAFTFTGLTAGQEYEIAFIGHGNNLDTTFFTIGAETKTNAPTDLGAATWTEGENYNTFIVTADSSGEVAGIWGPEAGTYAALSAVQLTTIPEPATLGLVVAMGGGLLFIRHRFMM